MDDFSLRKKMIRRLLFLAAFFFVVIILLEATLWMFFPLSSNDQGIEEVVTQNIPGLKQTIVYKTGRFGVRSLSEVAEEKPETDIRILCIGASTTDQPTQDITDTWHGILETKLRTAYPDAGITVQLLAFGRGGMKASDNAAWIRKYIDKLQPDIVITLLGINDLMWNGGRTYRYENISQRLTEREQQLNRAMQGMESDSWWRTYSQIARRISAISTQSETEKKLASGESIEWHSANLPNLREQYKRLPFAPRIFRNPDPINEFQDAVTWIVDFLRQKNTRVILLGQPVLWKDSLTVDEFNTLWFPINIPRGFVRASGEWLHKEMIRYNTIQQSIASQFNVPYIDLNAKIPKTADYFFDDCHYTDLGSRSVAEHVLPVLKETIDKLILQKKE